MTLSALRLHPDDNVACLLRDHAAGETPQLADGAAPVLREPVPMGHKIALTAIPAGAAVVKYGAVIGRSSRAIEPGSHVHLHNLAGEMR